jgi:tetratricopeptide (TPR) repeat protein
MGQAVRALAEFNEAIKLDPRSGESLAERAQVHEKTGERPRSIADLHAALAAEPKHRDAGIWRARLPNSTRPKTDEQLHRSAKRQAAARVARLFVLVDIPSPGVTAHHASSAAPQDVRGNIANLQNDLGTTEGDSNCTKFGDVQQPDFPQILQSVLITTSTEF